MRLASLDQRAGKAFSANTPVAEAAGAFWRVYRHVTGGLPDSVVDIIALEAPCKRDLDRLPDAEIDLQSAAAQCDELYFASDDDDPAGDCRFRAARFLSALAIAKDAKSTLDYADAVYELAHASGHPEQTVRILLERPAPGSP